MNALKFISRGVWHYKVSYLGVGAGAVLGAAVLLEENEQVIAGGKVGTWTYWAPEQADKSLPYDQSVDMWSLGVVLYIMLSGR